MTTDMVAPDEEFDPYAKLGDKQREWIADGQVDVYPGRDPQKPVIRWSAANTIGKHPGALAEGSGVSPRHVDSENGKRGAVKNMNEYVALMQRIASPEDGGAFEKVFMATLATAMEQKKKTDVECPECGHGFKVEVTIAGDPRAQKLVLEMMAGPPTKRTETSIDMRVLQADLSQLIKVDPAMLAEAFRPGLSAEEIKRRQDFVATHADEDVVEVEGKELT